MRLAIKSAIALSALLGLTACNSISSDLERRPEFQIKEIEQMGIVQAEANWLWQNDEIESGRKFVSRVDEDNKIWRADVNGQVYCLVANTGENCGVFTLANKISAGVGVDDDYIAVLAGDGDLVVADKKDGDIINRTELENRISNPPILKDNVVVLRPSLSSVEAYDAILGSMLWRYETDSSLISVDKPVESIVKGNEVFSGLSNGLLISQELVEGRLVWRAQLAPSNKSNGYKVASDIVASPVIHSSQLYVSVINEGITAYALGSRQVIFEAKINPWGTPTVDTDRLYVQTESAHIVAFDSLTGTVSWQQGDLRNRNLSNMVVTGAYLMVADQEGNLFMLKRETGEVEYVIEIEAGSTRLTAIGDYILIENQQGFIGALTQNNVALVK